MRLLLLCVAAATIFSYCVVSASYRHTGYRKKGKKCYQCAWSPPKLAYATVKKAVSYGSRSPIFGKSLNTVVNYGLKKVPVKVQGGWDKCHDAFTKYQADKYGIDQWECEHNCYTRTDKNGNLYRGCYKGEYNVSPKKLGCHYQAGSLYCFCSGELCNNKEAPEHKYFKSSKPDVFSYGYTASRPKTNFAVVTGYDYKPRGYNTPKFGYLGFPFVHDHDYNIGYQKLSRSFEKPDRFAKYESAPKFKKEKKDKYAGYDNYGKYDKHVKYDKYGKAKKYDEFSGKKYDSYEYDSKSRYNPRDSSRESDFEYGIVEDSRYGKHDDQDYETYSRNSRKYDSYEDGRGSYEQGYKGYRKHSKEEYPPGYFKSDQFSNRAHGESYPGSYRYRSSRKRPIKHYIHPIKEVQLNKHR